MTVPTGYDAGPAVFDCPDWLRLAMKVEDYRNFIINAPILAQFIALMKLSFFKAL